MGSVPTDTAKSQSVISVLYANARSVLPKRDDLSSLISSCDADVVLLSETWLNPDIDDNEILPDHPNFSIYRCDRADRPGGGVLIAVNKTIPCHIVSIQSALEIVSVSIKRCYGSILLGVCYRPPNASRDFCDCLRDDLSFLAAHSKTTFLFGDFNLPGIE